MNHTELQKLIAAGENFLLTKYLVQATLAIAVWDHLITFSDEVKYVWKGKKTWPFWLFVVSRYSILPWKTWVAITLFLPGYTQEIQEFKPRRESRCNRTVKLVGYYFIFTITLGHIFLTMRVYALTEASKFVLVVFGILVTSSFATGLWFVSVPSRTAIQMPKVPLDPYQACILTAPIVSTWAYRSQVAVADLITFVCIIVFVFKLKVDHGQSRMTRLMQTILQDGVLYFFVMAAFHIAMVFFTALHKPSFLPPAVIVVLIPVMISRLVISLRKAVDNSLIQVWDGDHFTGAESGEHETMKFACPPGP